MLGFFRSLGPAAVTVWRGSVDRGTGQQMKTCLTPCPPVWVAQLQKMLSMRMMQYPILIKRQVFCPCSLQHCTSSLGIQLDTEHQAGFLNVMQHVKIPSPGALNGWQLLLLLKGVLLSRGLSWSGCLLEIAHLLICTTAAQAVWSGEAWKRRDAWGSLIYSLLHSLACFLTLNMHQICVDDSSTRCTNPLLPLCMFTWWCLIVAATLVCSQNSICRMQSAEVSIFNVYCIIINGPEN